MFAPKMSRVQTKAPESPHRNGGAVVMPRALHGTNGHQTILRAATQRLAHLPVKRAAERREQEAAAETVSKRETPRGASWGSSKIPLFEPDRAIQPQARPSLSAPSLAGNFQSNHSVGDVNDPLEHEADRVADQVLTRDRHPTASGTPPRSRPYPSTRSSGRVYSDAGAPPGGVAEVLRSPGRPLDATTRAEFEPRFGQDFGQVRLHNDTQAAAAAHSIRALAFTFDTHIVFGDAQSVTDRRLLAHELTHVVQQSGIAGAPSPVQRPGEARPAIARAPAPPDRQLSSGLPAGVQLVELSKIEYTQPGVSYTTSDGEPLGQMAARMRKSGWDLADPADIVQMKDGRLVSVDHRRLWAADRAGLTQISARIHLETDEVAGATAARFAIGKGRVPRGTNPRTGTAWKVGDVPRTWGDAISFRSAVQDFQKLGRVTNSGFDPTALPGGGVRDPSFPATGSKNMPMRMQPGPLEQRIDPTAGGSVIKSGGVRKNVPSGKIVTGEINSKTPVNDPSGGRSGPTGPGGSGPVADTRPTVTEGRGATVGEIAAAPHAQSIDAARGSVEGAWSMILAGQLSYVRGAELQKAVDALIALEPTIEQDRQKGIDVTVTVVAEVPDHPDVAGYATGTGDASQVVLFRDMYISHLSLPASAATSTVSTAYDAGGHSRDYVGQGDMTLDQRIRSQLGEKYPVPGTGPHAGFHFVEGQQVFPGYPPPKPAGPPMATRTQGIAGTWTPEFRDVFTGNFYQVLPLADRVLRVDVDAGGMATPRLIQGGYACAFEDGGPNTTKVMTGRFKVGEGYPPQAQWYWSAFEYLPDKRLILEWVHGQDRNYAMLWDALFLWRHL
jgi:Domain of unknown function (DUF4157)